jgi:hypothetical protein
MPPNFFFPGPGKMKDDAKILGTYQVAGNFDKFKAFTDKKFGKRMKKSENNTNSSKYIPLVNLLNNNSFKDDNNSSRM